VIEDLFNPPLKDFKPTFNSFYHFLGIPHNCILLLKKKKKNLGND